MFDEWNWICCDVLALTGGVCDKLQPCQLKKTHYERFQCVSARRTCRPLQQGDFARSRELGIENKAERLPYQLGEQARGSSEFILETTDRIWIYSGCSIVKDRAFSAGGRKDISETDENTIFILFFCSRSALSCPPNDTSKPSFSFQLPQIQLVITSCCRDVSSPCYHLKGVTRTSNFDRIRSNPL